MASHLGVDYFLAPIPTFSLDDERNLADAIKRDEEEAGKETVFAANLKKALKLIKQGRTKGEEGAALPVSQQQPVPAVIASASPQGSNSAASQPTSQGGATWQDYMFQGISTGLDFAKAGAGTATSTNDPSTVYASLGEKTSGSFDALNQKSYGSAPAAPGSRRMLFVDHQDRF